MAPIKSYTDIEQSCKLAEILPLESADMYWRSLKLNGHISWTSHIKRLEPPIYDLEHYIPCWSLAALLRLIPNFNMLKRTIECKIETPRHSIDKACDLVDAAFEMVCWLKENNKL